MGTDVLLTRHLIITQQGVYLSAQLHPGGTDVNSAVCTKVYKAAVLQGNKGVSLAAFLGHREATEPRQSSEKKRRCGSETDLHLKGTDII